MKSLVARLREPLSRTGGRSPLQIRHDIQETNWLKVGIIRNQKDLEEALPIFRSLSDDVERASVAQSNAYNMVYNVWLDTRSMIDVSIMAATSALLRDETRGAHTRLDFPEQRDDYGLFNTFLWRGDDGMPVTEKKPVEFTHKPVEACQKWKK